MDIQKKSKRNTGTSILSPLLFIVIPIQNQVMLLGQGKLAHLQCFRFYFEGRNNSPTFSSESTSLVSISFTFSSCLKRSSLSGPYVEGICQNIIIMGFSLSDVYRFELPTKESFGRNPRTKPGTYLWIAANIAACPTAVTCGTYIGHPLEYVRVSMTEGKENYNMKSVFLTEANVKLVYYFSSPRKINNLCVLQMKKSSKRSVPTAHKQQ